MANEKLKLKAKRMIQSGNYQLDYIAKAVGVSVKTLWRWRQKYGWTGKYASIGLHETNDPLMSYLQFLKTEHPQTYRDVQKTVADYLSKATNTNDG